MVMKRWYRYITICFVVLLLSSCSSVSIYPFPIPSALDPHGPIAAHQADLWWVMLAFTTAVFLLVVFLLFAAIFRRRWATSTTAPDSKGGDLGRKWLIIGGIALPLVVISILFGYSVSTFSFVESLKDNPEEIIKVIGHRWWWEVEYPGHNITTANEIHIPVGVPVQLELEAADVIHSFWVPELSGKLDVVPTEINHLNLQVDDVGIYHGQCAEYCGIQHANMGFLVIAESNEDFNAWLDEQQQSIKTPTDQSVLQGQQVFMSAGCVFCHTVVGLDDKAIDRSAVDLGPDLTHIQSRMMIAGATLTNNRGNLEGWIANAQNVKPGVLMPNMSLNSQDLQAVLAYLEYLK